jgi:hypothetical protein
MRCDATRNTREAERKTLTKNTERNTIMGDRGNIVVRSSQSNRDDVWFYGHWSGYRIQETVHAALTRGKGRWGDSSYLARIVFDEFTKDHHGEETGFGISASLGDNEYPIIVIDDEKRRVFLIEEKELSDYRIPDGYEPRASWTYEEFIGLPVAEGSVLMPG